MYEFAVSVLGGELRVYLEGEGRDIVLLHAGVADSRSWNSLIPGLVERGCRTIRYDARNYGRSTTIEGPYSARDDLFRVMDAVGSHSATLIGNSRGGSTAIDAAFERPERVKA